MYFFLNFSVILIAFLLQNTLGIHIKLGPITPDFALIAVVSVGLIEAQIAGLSSGFFAGILKDLISLRGFGVNALTHTLIGYISGAINSEAVNNSFMLMTIVAAFTLLANFLYMMIAFLVSYQINYLFWMHAFIAALYNALISPLVYLPISYVYRRYINKAQGLEIVKNG